MVCKDCKYWDVGEDDRNMDAVGYCLRKAPAPLVCDVDELPEKSYVTLWPLTVGNEGCGEGELLPVH